MLANFRMRVSRPAAGRIKATIESLKRFGAAEFPGLCGESCIGSAVGLPCLRVPDLK
jgi:hypothetical protein